MNAANFASEPFRVLIAGGGVPALEAALALGDLAGGRLSTTLIAPEPGFVYRPMTVGDTRTHHWRSRMQLTGQRRAHLVAEPQDRHDVFAPYLDARGLATATSS